MQFKFKKLQQDIIGITLPAIPGDAGYDLYASEEVAIPARGAGAVKTGICIQLPPGYWFEIMSKSGLATKHNLAAHNGVIDSGYRGEVIVYMYNHSDKPYTFKKNEKVAQGVIRQQIVMELGEVNELNNTARGDKGFGSTGK